MRENFELLEDFQGSDVSDQDYYTEDSTEDSAEDSTEMPTVYNFQDSIKEEPLSKDKLLVNRKDTSEITSKSEEAVRKTSREKTDFPGEDKDPFLSLSGWSDGHMHRLHILMPTEDDMIETTNDLTRDRCPEMRYWKSIITFWSGNFDSNCIRLSNIQIPFVGNKNYGKNYVYMSLPIELRERILIAVGKDYILNPDDKTIPKQNGYWYKAVNGIEGSFGIGDPVTRDFAPRDIGDIFAATGLGIVATVHLKFFCKANTTKMQDLNSAVPRTVSVELIRGYISNIKVKVPPPQRRAGAASEEQIPVLTSNDLADEKLIRDLRKLGLN